MDVMLADALAPLWAAIPAWASLEGCALDTFERHGHAARWKRALAALPERMPSTIEVGDVVAVGKADDIDDIEALRETLGSLHPWRKGPFHLFGVAIDAEWRSDLKWQRVVPHLAPLEGRRVLDVGCGNGYYGWRMCAAGASLVIGIEANAGHVAQYLAIGRYARAAIPHHHVLPLRFEALEPAVPFDTVLSMGVLYHQRDPAAHLARLRRFVRTGGEVVIESLIVDAERSLVLDDGRYARMKNVHTIPTIDDLRRWLANAGFVEPRFVDVTATTTVEQRRTAWMRFESLAHALDPDDPRRTVEGHPAPTRAIVLARAP
jgi:tRNA (mo5U34)-methyltransferase